jgi:arginine repressor
MKSSRVVGRAIRRAFLATLLQSEFPGFQRELLAYMNLKGFTSTQPTLSEDLKELDAVTTRSGIVLRSALRGAP